MTSAGMQNVHVCIKKKRSMGSVLEDFRMLVFCCQLQFLLFLHVAVPSHDAQVAPIHRQQHHGRREGSVADVSQALSSDHGGDPEREARKVQPQKRRFQDGLVCRWTKDDKSPTDVPRVSLIKIKGGSSGTCT